MSAPASPRDAGSFQPGDGLTFLFTLMLYISTLSPGVLPADAGELQLVAAKLGVAHPPGYPFYTMLAAIFARLAPSPAAGVNVFSAVTAALAATLVGRAVRWIATPSPDRVHTGRLAGILAAATAALTPAIWVTGTQASIRPLMACLMAFSVERLLAYRANGDLLRLASFGLALGLSVCHHLSLAAPCSCLAGYLVLTDNSLLRRGGATLSPDWQKIAALSGGLALGFLPWLYLPVRGAMGAILAPPDLATWAGFWRHVSASGFSGDFFAFRTPAELADRALVWWNIVNLQWNLTLLALFAFGTAALAVMDRSLMAALVVALGLHSLLAMTYRAPQTIEYLIPAYVLMAVLLGGGLGRLLAASRTPVAISFLLLGIMGGGAIALGIETAPSLAFLSSDRSTRLRLDVVFETARPQAVVLAPWHWVTPLWYAQQVEGWRQDLEIVYVYPQGAEALGDTWVRQIEARMAMEEDVLVLGYYPEPFAASRFHFERLVGGWRVRRGESVRVHSAASPLATFEEAGAAPYSLMLIGSPLQAGEAFEAVLTWRLAEQGPASLTSFVHFSRADGSVISAYDVPLVTDGQLRGGDVTLAYRLGVPPELDPSDTYVLLAGVYHGEQIYTAAGNPRPVIHPGLRIVPPAFPFEQPLNGIPFAEGIILERTQVRAPQVPGPGDEIVIDLHFRATRPILTDQVVKVDLVAGDYAWRVQSDHIPATGALPTLKWLAGWQVVDRHRLRIPAEAQHGPLRAEVVLYDHFTGQPLPVLDPALAQQGVGITVWEWIAEAD